MVHIIMCALPSDEGRLHHWIIVEAGYQLVMQKFNQLLKFQSDLLVNWKSS